MRRIIALLLGLSLCLCPVAVAQTADLSGFTEDQLQAELERRKQANESLEIYKRLYAAFEQNKFPMIEEYNEEPHSFTTTDEVFYAVSRYVEYRIRESEYEFTVLFSEYPIEKSNSSDKARKYLSVFMHACFPNAEFEAFKQAMAPLNAEPGITIAGDRVTTVSVLEGRAITLVMEVSEYESLGMSLTVSRRAS